MAKAAPSLPPPEVSSLGGQAHVLERIARGAPLSEVLEAIVTLIESAAPGMLCSILLIDRDGKRLRHGAAPNLPASYNAAVDGLEIGPRAGSCGTAAFTRHPVIVRDVQVDPLWENYRALADPHGLRACWSTPIFSAAGRVLGTFAMYYREPRVPTSAEQDLITTATDLAGIAIARHRAEEALRESEERFSKAFHANPAPISITRLADGRFLDVNAAFLALTGYAREDVIGRTSLELRLIGSVERDDLVDRLRRSGAIPDLGFSIRHRDGAKRDVVVSLVLCDLGGEACTLGIFQDVTDRKRAEEALRTRERQLLLAQQIAHMGSWEWDIRGGAVTWSDEMWRIFGLQPGALRVTYEGFLELVHPDDRGFVREINDVLGQTLTALKLDVSSLREMVAHREPGADTRLQEIAGLLDTAIKDVRRLASELRPVVLDQLGLPAAVEWLTRDFQRRTGIECRVRSHLPEIAVPADVSTGLFRILQEALTNVARHSAATRVDVTLEHASRILYLDVTDNGRGLSEAAQANQDSLGILGMRERALLLGGFIDLKGETGTGTKLTAWVPLK